MSPLYYVLLGAALTAVLLPLLYVVLRRRVTYTDLTIDDLIDSLQQINQALLIEIAQVVQEPLAAGEAAAGVSPAHRDISLETRRVLARAKRRSYDYRRHLRLRIDRLRDFTQRMQHNTSKAGHVAYADLCNVRRHKLKYLPEAIDSIYVLIDANDAFQKYARSILRKTWFWSALRFEQRTWGPIPDLTKFDIPRLLEAYNRVKEAAETYATFYGDVGRLISQEIKESM